LPEVTIPRFALIDDKLAFTFTALGSYVYKVPTTGLVGRTPGSVGFCDNTEDNTAGSSGILKFGVAI
jgi:hypothetical protein